MKRNLLKVAIYIEIKYEKLKNSHLPRKRDICKLRV